MVFRSLRDKVSGSVEINGRRVGSIKSFSTAFSNSPIEFEELDTRCKMNYAGALSLSGRVEKKHGLTLDANLFELATGHKLVDSDGKLLLRPEDDLAGFSTLSQYLSDAVTKIYKTATETYSVAQSFIASSKVLDSEKFYCGKEGTFSAKIELKLHPDDGTGKPNMAIQLAIGTFSKPLVDSWIVSEYKWRTPDGVLTYSSLVPGTKYWLMFSQADTTGSSSNYFGLKYLSSKDNFIEGELLKYDGSGFSALNYDASLEIVFTHPEFFEVILKATDGTKTMLTKFKRVKFTVNEFIVEPYALVIDTGSWVAEDVEVAVT